RSMQRTFYQCAQCVLHLVQAYPKDLRALPGRPELAVSWHSGSAARASRSAEQNLLLMPLGCPAPLQPSPPAPPMAGIRAHAAHRLGLLFDGSQPLRRATCAILLPGPSFIAQYARTEERAYGIK